MLELRPGCEHCAKPLPPAATDAMICSFECTFCRDCALGLLGNVCPNCGGGFQARPRGPRTTGTAATTSVPIPPPRRSSTGRWIWPRTLHSSPDSKA